MAQAVQAQWNLDHSAGSAISVARGILQAATSDNVQPLAILACERFGNTLAISQETCGKIERHVIATPEPAVLEFLRATVGFRKGDCASQIGSSLAGIRFLALAAALMSMMDTYPAAKAVQTMIAETAADKTLVPTIRHIEDLLQSVEPRCRASGFATEVMGWHNLLTSMAPSVDEEMEPLKPRFPQDDGVRSLVDALRQLGRIGDHKVSGIKIQTDMGGVAWTVAFVKWCLGVPPSVILSDGTCALDQNGAIVEIRVLEYVGLTTRPFRVTLQSTLGSLTELIVTRLAPVSEIRSLVSIPVAGTYLLRNCGFDTDLGLRTIEEALPYALRLAKDHLIFNEQMGADEVQLGPQNVVQDHRYTLRLSPFAEDDALTDMTSLLFGIKNVKKPRSLDGGTLLSDLPVFSLHLRRLTEAHSCADCDASSPAGICPRVRSANLVHLSKIATVVLTLSLLKNPEQLQVTPFLDEECDLQSCIKDIIKGKTYQFCDIEWISEAVRGMLLHRLDFRATPEGASRRGLVLTCLHGQAVWMEIHQTQRISKTGYSTMLWHPGSLIYNKEGYDIAHGASGEGSARKNDAEHINKTWESLEVSQVCNMMPRSGTPIWIINALPGRIIGVSYSLELQPTGCKPLKWIVMPNMIHWALANSVLLETCGHSPEAKLHKADIRANFKFHQDSFLRDSDSDTEEETSTVRVVPANGDDVVRYMTLLGWARTDTSFVLRREACLQCCLDVCREIRSTLLIL